MAESYPRRDQARGIWKINNITKNIKELGTYPKASTTGIAAGGLTPGYQKGMDTFTVETTGNATDFGDLTIAVQGHGALGSFTRAVFGGGYVPGGTTNVIDYVHFKTTGNAADFGDLTSAGHNMGEAGTGNNTRGLWFGRGAPQQNVIDFITIASTGNATDFGDATVSVSGASSLSSPTRAVSAGGYVAPGESDVINFVEISTTGNAVDFGNLTAGGRKEIAATSSSTRGVFSGGANQSPQVPENVIDYINIGSLGNAVNFGDLTVARFRLAGSSNSLRGVLSGGETPTKSNVMDFITLESAGNATDFGDLTVAKTYLAGCSNGHGGLEAFHPRAPELYSPTGKPFGSGGGVGDIAVRYGGALWPDTPQTNIGFIKISTDGNEADFGDAGTANRLSSGIGGATRALFTNIYTTGYTSTTKYITFATKGNDATFGDATLTRYSAGTCSNDTRGVTCGGTWGGGSPYATNVIDYYTLATLGNATDFGDNVGVIENGPTGFGSTTRGVFSGGQAQPSGITNIISYITIGSTGNATDFGDLTVARNVPGGLSSSTRGITFCGGEPAASNVIDYVTIASTGNAIDFGDAQISSQYRTGASNDVRGVIMGGRQSPKAYNTIDKITIASTGNATDYGDLSQEVGQSGSASNGHGGLS